MRDGEEAVTAVQLEEGYGSAFADEPVFDQAACERAEEEALAQVFADVRNQSARGQLVGPMRFEATGVTPQHLKEEDFEMLVYDVLEQAHAAKADLGESEAAVPVFRSATQAVGVPRPIGASPEAGAEPEEVGAEGKPETDAPSAAPDDEQADEPVGSDMPGVGLADGLLFDFDVPDGYELIELEGEPVLVPLEDFEAEEDPLACDDIVALVGKHSYYLYSRDFMTDAYAHWAFLVQEDDRMLTFVDCVREESRVYPRPMLASSLSNEPFCMTQEEIAETWKAVSESGEYPDIGQVFASNGEAFFFSEEHLSRAYAQSLAEWYAVERVMNL